MADRMGRRPRHHSILMRLLAFVVIFGLGLALYYYVIPLYLTSFFTSLSGGSATTANDYLLITEYLSLIVGFVGGLYVAWKF